ncbi:MAG TPA: ABC transporter substrate-binding protein [Pseudolysinimonas sp.]|nr:ABC transporter substrate-binding protein [Pseudolysinimonas sp.]
MTSGTNNKRLIGVLAGSAAFALVLAGCQTGGDDGGDSGGGGESIIVGTTDTVISLDPAGSYDNGSLSLQTQVFGHLLNTVPGDAEVVPDLAESAEFTSETEYTVKLKPGLKWANGNDLTASDVAFSFDRQVAIADDNGPSVLLYNLESTEAVDDTTVVFHLIAGNDQIFPQILTSQAGIIVDEDTFLPDAVTPDDDIVKANAFSGQYVITSYDFNNLVSLEANPEYGGALGEPKTKNIDLKYYTDSSNLKLDVQEGNIDVAYRSLSATDVADLEGNDDVTVTKGPGGEIRYITFNFNIQPFGAETPEADPAKALAVRQAVANLVDREAIADEVYKGTYLPLYSYVPDGFVGATQALKDEYGDGNGGPDAEAAAAVLEAAGITTPVALNLQYNPDHYGESSGDEYAQVKSQLEADGLFTVNLQSTEWVTYQNERKNTYPVFQMGWFPDYADADNYLTPFFIPTPDQDGNLIGGGFLQNRYENPEVTALINAQAVELDPEVRKSDIEEVQTLLAQDLPTIPLLQGAQIAVTGSAVTGATLDGSFKFRFATLVKG